MKKALSIAALLLAVLMLVMCCTACGDDEKKDDATTAPTTAGSTEATAPAATDATEQATEAPVVSDSPLAGDYTLEQDGNTGTLTIKNDNTGVLKDTYTTYDLTFNTADSTVAIVVYGTTLDGTYTFDGTTLEISANDATLIFKKADEQTGTPAAGTLAGSYSCVDIIGEVTGLTAEQLEQVKAAYLLEIKEDGSAIITAMGAETECVFDPETMTVIPSSVEGDPLPYSYDGTKLSIEISEDITLVFTK